MSDLEQIRDNLSVYADYLEHFTPQSKERDMAIIKLKEVVFWLTYIIDEEV